MGIHPQPYDPLTITGASSYSNPDWLTALAASKITGTLTKSQQHAQTAYKDEANTWAETQTFNGLLLPTAGMSLSGDAYVRTAIYVRGSDFVDRVFIRGTEGTVAVQDSLILGGESGPKIDNSGGTIRFINNAKSGWWPIQAGGAAFNGTVNFGNGSLIGGSGIDNILKRITYLQAPNDTFFGRIDIDGISAGWANSSGQVSLGGGGASNSGLLAFYKTDTTRRGYIGFDTNSSNDFSFTNELSGIFSFNKGATFNDTVRIAGSTQSRLYLGAGGLETLLDNGDVDENFVIRQTQTGGGMYLDVGTTYGLVVRRNTDYATMFSVTNTGAATFNGTVTSTSTGKLGDFTVATLPSAASNAGYEANVTDSSVTTFGSTVAGGGSSRVKVYSNGTNWTVQAV